MLAISLIRGMFSHSLIHLFSLILLPHEGLSPFPFSRVLITFEKTNKYFIFDEDKLWTCESEVFAVGPLLLCVYTHSEYLCQLIVILMDAL